MSAMDGQFEKLNSTLGDAYRCVRCGECVWIEEVVIGKDDAVRFALEDHWEAKHSLDNVVPFNPPKKTV